jgi:hypothetical protein
VGNNAINTLNGGSGADWIVGGPGNDILNGDAGADVLVWSNGDGTDVDEGGADSDTVYVNGSVSAADVFVVSPNGARIDFDRTNLGLFSLDIGATETLTVNGVGGDDSFTVNDLTGVATLTTLNLNGFAGNDTFTYVPISAGAVAFKAHGSTGTDTLQGPNGTATWNVTAANQGNIAGLVTSFSFIETLSGGSGSDTFNVKAFATGTPTVSGGAGNDTLSYNAEGRAVSGDATPPDGVIDSPGVQSLTFTQIETVNTSPTISTIANQTTNEDTATSAIAFTVGDLETAAASLTVSGSSSNTTLVPNANVVFGGSGASRTVTVTPAAGQSGTATITVTVSDGTLSTPTTFVLTVGTAPTMSIDRTTLQFAATNSGASLVQQTAAQTVRLTQTGAGTVTWTATSNQPWLTVTPASGTGSATLTIAVVFNSALPVNGSSTGSIALAFTGAGNTAGPIGVTLTTKPNGTGAEPFGVFDTPAEGTTGVTGSIAVTGWALDDIEVRQVRILRDPVAGEGPSQIFIGNAVLVEGARPDVAALYPALPRNTRAGWGYLLLTNFLPNQGNGTFRLFAYADDAEGHLTPLGSKTITCTNSTATRPFGAIDTPAQGETVNGATYNNFGWVLVRGPALAYPPYGTVQVVIDGIFGASPGGWTSRSDLTALFPAATYPGVTNALGVASLDTTTLTNGVHTIAWVVTADNGQADGIGSRYFTVANGSSLVGSGFTAPDSLFEGSGASLRDEVNRAALDRAEITGQRGYDLTTPARSFAVGASDRVTVDAEELDRIDLQLGDPGGHRYTGYLRVGNELGPLPIGSRLDPATGQFTWQPGVGFVHAYDLVFVRWMDGQAIARQEVRIVLNPKRSNRIGPQVVIDTPGSQKDVAQPFVLAGWAIDADSEVGTGVETLHVWAYPLTGANPIFVGVASYGGTRPDVASIFGERFTDSGYGLTVNGLAPGNYDLAVFAWSTAQNGFVPAKVVRVTVR